MEGIIAMIISFLPGDISFVEWSEDEKESRALDKWLYKT
jgi:hypothetical protein